LERAAVGFRVKSGWAAVALVDSSTPLPTLLDVRAVQLADPAVPDSTQPYHAGLDVPNNVGIKTVARLVKIVERFSRRSVVDLLKEYAKSRRLVGVGVVAGSLVDPATMTNDHIRAHAEEGRLFRVVVVDAAKTLGLMSTVVAEKGLYAEASTRLRRPVPSLKKDLVALGQGVDGPWRSEQKNAALAAWMALA